MTLSIPSLPRFEFYQRLSPRERTLTLLVAGTAFLLGNVLVLSLLIGGFREGRRAYSEKSQDLRLQEIFAREQPMWAQRISWLKTRQPPLSNRDRAGTELLVQVQGAARASGVIITNPQIKPPPINPAGGKEPGSHDYQAVSVEIDTESDWDGMIGFLQALQRPEGFIVFDLATLRSDPGNATRMKGQFRISKWYAPSKSSSL